MDEQRKWLGETVGLIHYKSNKHEKKFDILTHK